MNYGLLERNYEKSVFYQLDLTDVADDYVRMGSPFSIPKAALGLCGFLPEFTAEGFDSLHEQLEAFGGGLELTLLATIPAGSGLRTSSLLASTVLGALNDFCGVHSKLPKMMHS